MSITTFLNRINQYILNPLILLIFAIAFIIFAYGIFEFINSETADNQREKGKKKILYGLIGMFIMFAAYGLVRFILNTLGISPPPSGWYPNRI